MSCDQVWSCYIQESFKGRTVLRKLMFSYLLWAIFYYWNFILNKYHYFRYFSRSLYKMSELLCNVHAFVYDCLSFFRSVSFMIHLKNKKKSCFPKRWISHAKEKMLWCITYFYQLYNRRIWFMRDVKKNNGKKAQHFL